MPLDSSRWPGRVQRLASTLHCLRRRRGSDLRRRCDSVPPDSESGRSRTCCHLSGLRFAVRPTNIRCTADLQQLGQLLRAVLACNRSGDRLCALVIGMVAVTGNGLSGRPHSIGDVCRFLYPLTGDLSSRNGQSCSEVDSAKSGFLGGSDDRFFRARGRGACCESKGPTCGSPADRDAGELWATRVGAVDAFSSLQSYELERKCRDLRDCWSSMDSR